VRRALTETGLNGTHLTLEITEKALVRDTEQAKATIRGLKQIGVNVAIDDFGTGYSSFAQLKSLPLDELKIDRCFITNLGHNPDDLAIVRSIIGLADSFGLRVVAEGVESEIAAATLIALGCVHAQGFLFGEPCPAADLELNLAPTVNDPQSNRPAAAA
jgi:EAL domain-containing protein (putative c-di-GMP-specific phosphodiesterase class I)